MNWKYDKKQRVWGVHPHDDPSCVRCIVSPSYGGKLWSFQARSTTGNDAFIAGTAKTVEEAKANCEEFADKYGTDPKIREQLWKAMRQSQEASERNMNARREGNNP